MGAGGGAELSPLLHGQHVYSEKRECPESRRQMRPPIIFSDGSLFAGRVWICFQAFPARRPAQEALELAAFLRGKMTVNSGVLVGRLTNFRQISMNTVEF